MWQACEVACSARNSEPPVGSAYLSQQALAVEQPFSDQPPASSVPRGTLSTLCIERSSNIGVANEVDCSARNRDGRAVGEERLVVFRRVKGVALSGVPIRRDKHWQ